MDVFIILSWTFSAIYIFTIISIIVVILLDNREPIKSLAWVTVLVMLPVLGIILYFFLGRDFRKQKIISRKSIRKIKDRPIPECDISKVDTHILTQQQKNLIKLLMRIGEAPVYPGNKLELYVDGPSTFNALFHAIENAQQHIHIEFFIFEDDKISNALRELLIKKAKQGVRVRMIYDYLGSWRLPKSYIQSLRDAGVYVRSFLPVRFRWARIKINYRNHRKVVVVDGKIGFTGGLNIADRYLVGNKLGKWRDTFVRIEGAAVHGLQSNFLIDWFFVDRKLIVDPKYYPEMPYYEDNLVQFVASGPDSDWPNIMCGLSQAIMTATKYVYMHTPYFMPPEVVTSAVYTAALSGIDVRLLVPEKSDSPLSSAATKTYITRLLEAGVRVYFYTGNFLHSKCVVIDDMISSVGSANLDERSSNQNFELNAFIYDVDTAQLLKQYFWHDLESSYELTLSQWENRSRWARLKESFARLFVPIM